MPLPSSLSPKRLAAVLLALPLLVVPARAQQVAADGAPAHSADIPSSTDLPDAPGTSAQTTAAAPQSTSAAQPDSAVGGRQTRRILGIVPNFRSVSVDAKLPPLTVKQKFIGATEDSFDYSSFIFAGILAGVSMAQNSYPQFHQGAAGYGRYYWHTAVDQIDENYMVEFFLPVALRQDPRYYTLERGGFFKRVGYSFSRIAITRQDDGSSNFNYSEVVGAGAAAGISALYYPGADRTWTKVGQRWATSVGLDGLTFVFKEFWPDINDHLFHQKD